MFNEYNTQETWQLYKSLGGLKELEKHKPIVSNIVWELYSIFSECRCDLKRDEIITTKIIEENAHQINFEMDKIIQVIKSADKHYLKLCIDKEKRNNQK